MRDCIISLDCYDNRGLRASRVYPTMRDAYRMARRYARIVHKSRTRTDHFPRYAEAWYAVSVYRSPGDYDIYPVRVDS